MQERAMNSKLYLASSSRQEDSLFLVELGQVGKGIEQNR